jgi:hypothetical protein
LYHGKTIRRFIQLIYVPISRFRIAALIPDKIRTRIESLRLKTVQNGATPDEERAAQRMALELLNKYSKQVDNQRPAESKKNSQLDEFLAAKNDGSLLQKIYLFDWDVIAHEILSHHDYMDYIELTHKFWEQNMHWRMKVNPFTEKKTLTDEEYRYKCFVTLNNICKLVDITGQPI